MKPRVILAGGGGFLGMLLTEKFVAKNYEVIVLTRSPKKRSDDVKEVFWDAKNIGEWTRWFDGCETVINLTGKSVDCRYNEKNRREIVSSRVDSTRVIGMAIVRTKLPPRVWLNASSATIYKHSFDEPNEENGETGATPEAKDEFSIEVIRRWEQALDEVHTPGTRKIALRAALVLGRHGGAFPIFRRLARFGLCGAMGDGRQMFSWVHEKDFTTAVEWIIDHNDLTGPVNIAAPNPQTNRAVMCQIRQAVGASFGLSANRWLLEIGAFFLRTETELLIKSRYAVPGKLLASGFRFQFPHLSNAVLDLCR